MLDKVVGFFGYGGATATGGTAFIQGIEPFKGIQGAAPLLYQRVPGSQPTPGSNLGVPNWWGTGPNSALSRITNLIYTTGGSTAQKLTFMTPLNFAYVTTDVAANTATFILDKDPGLYSTSYRYRLYNNHAPSSLANNAIAAGDYVAYQLNDGTWVFDTVASGTYAALVLTTSTPNVSGGGVLAGTAMFFFGITTDKDPFTGKAPPNTTIPASSAYLQIGSQQPNLWGTTRPGDPMIVYSANSTNAGFIDALTGVYVGCP